MTQEMMTAEERSTKFLAELNAVDNMTADQCYDELRRLAADSSITILRVSAAAALAIARQGLRDIRFP